MNIFIKHLILDLKQLLNRRIVLLLILFLVIALYFVNSGINQYHRLQADTVKLENLEKIPRQYDRLYKPTPLSVFFASPGTTRPGGSAFDRLNAEFMNYSGFLLYFGSLFFLLIGCQAYANMEYLKFITALSGKSLPIHFSLLISRALLIIFFVILVSEGGWLLAVIRGIPFAPFRDFIVFRHISLLTVLVFGFFLLLGMIWGTIRSRNSGITALMASWIILVFIIPAGLGKYISNKAHDSLSPYPVDQKKTAQLIDDYLTLSAYAPTTFYLSLTREASGCGLSGRSYSDNSYTGPSSAAELLPVTTAAGSLMLISFTCILAGVLAFRSWFTAFGPFAGYRPGTGHLEITAAAGEKRLFNAPGGFVRLFFNRLAGGLRQYEGKLRIAGRDIAAKKINNEKFIYLTGPELLPGNMKVRSLAGFIKRMARLPKAGSKKLDESLAKYMGKPFKELSGEEKVEVMMVLARNIDSKIYMLEDFVHLLAPEAIRRIDRQLEEIRDQGRVVFYFNTNPSYNPPIMDFKSCDVVSEAEDRYIKESL